MSLYVQKKQEDENSAKIEKKIFKMSGSNSAAETKGKNGKNIFFVHFFCTNTKKIGKTQGNYPMTVYNLSKTEKSAPLNPTKFYFGSREATKKNSKSRRKIWCRILYIEKI